jgi:UDP-N-acetylglucosamine--N-acetylmuramyl-(pentapeptide) pyrophosphoryl-undecaprenol N-acetylglucosamine transferase
MTIVKSVVVMAGGTGGHVFPALAVARGLQAEGVKVHWLGTARGIEADIVPKAGIAISYLNVGGLRGNGLLPLLQAPFKLLVAVWQAMAICRRVNACHCISMSKTPLPVLLIKLWRVLPHAFCRPSPVPLPLPAR